jgi:hypothetical protein
LRRIGETSSSPAARKSDADREYPLYAHIASPLSAKIRGNVFDFELPHLSVTIRRLAGPGDYVCEFFWRNKPNLVVLSLSTHLAMKGFQVFSGVS